MSALAVQSGMRGRSRDDRHAWNGPDRKCEARYRTDARILGRHSAPNTVYHPPVKIDDARRIFAQNLDPRWPVRQKILGSRKLEQRQSFVVDGRHGCYPLDGANIFRNASQGSTVSNSLIAKRNQCFGLVVDYGTSPRCSGNKSRLGSFRDSGCAA
jgi:hypothetical protein